MSRNQTGQFLRRPARRLTSLGIVATLLALSLATGNLAGFRPAQATNTHFLRSAPAHTGELPLSFIANAGQTDASVRFQVRNNGSALFFAASSVTLSLPAASSDMPTHGGNHPHAKPPTQVALQL